MPPFCRLKRIFRSCGRFFSEPARARLEEPPAKPVPAFESERIGHQRKNGSREEASYHEWQRRMGKKRKDVRRGLTDWSSSQGQRAELVLRKKEKWRRQGIAHPGARDGRRDVRPNEKRDQRGGQHLERQGHHGKKDADRTSRREARALRLPELKREQPVAQLTVQPRAPHMLYARKAPQIRPRRTPPPLTRLHPGGKNPAIFLRISACQGSLCCLNTLLYEED